MNRLFEVKYNKINEKVDLKGRFLCGGQPCSAKLASLRPPGAMVTYRLAKMKKATWEKVQGR